jgi:hypothetical protein
MENEKCKVKNISGLGASPPVLQLRVVTGRLAPYRYCVRTKCSHVSGLGASPPVLHLTGVTGRLTPYR